MDSVYKFIDSLNIKSEYVVAAISGGPDSMFLLEVLKKQKVLIRNLEILQIPVIQV